MAQHICPRVVFCDSAEKVLLINLDLRSLNEEFLAPVRKLVEEKVGIPYGNIVFTVNHNHSCPDTNMVTYNDDIKDYRDLGRNLAKTALKALRNAKELPLGKLQYRQQVYMAPVDHRRDDVAPRALEIAQMKDPEERKAALRASGINNHLIQWSIIRKYRMEKEQETELCSISLGEVSLAFCPHEMFNSLGQKLRKASPYEMTFFCNYAQTYRGYMPAQEMVPHGEYEVDTCYYLPGTGEKELEILLTQLQDMYQN